MAAVLKTARGLTAPRGFESHALRCRLGKHQVRPRSPCQRRPGLTRFRGPVVYDCERRSTEVRVECVSKFAGNLSTGPAPFGSPPRGSRSPCPATPVLAGYTMKGLRRRRATSRRTTRTGSGRTARRVTSVRATLTTPRRPHRPKVGRWQSSAGWSTWSRTWTAPSPRRTRIPEASEEELRITAEIDHPWWCHHGFDEPVLGHAVIDLPWPHPDDPDERIVLTVRADRLTTFMRAPARRLTAGFVVTFRRCGGR
jgi:hypothetical protein